MPKLSILVSALLTSSLLMAGGANAGYTFRVGIEGVRPPPVTVPVTPVTPVTPVAGVCGDSGSATLASAPTANLCSVGTATEVTGTGPWSWQCPGTDGGSTATCSAALENLTLGTPTTLALTAFLSGYPSYNYLVDSNRAVGLGDARVLYGPAYSLSCKTSGKWYWEVQVAGGYVQVGATTNPTVSHWSSDWAGFYTNSIQVKSAGGTQGTIANGTPSTSSAVPSWGTVGFALDMDARAMQVFINGVAQPANNWTVPSGSCVHAAVWNHTGDAGWAYFKFGQNAFSYPVPAHHHAGFD